MAELLEFVGIADKADRHPRQLSAGRSNVWASLGRWRPRRASSSPTRPPAHWNPDTTAEILSLLRRVNRELGTTIVVITHEMDVIREICDRVAVLDHGRLIEQGDVYDVFARPQSEITRRLVRSAVGDVPVGGDVGAPPVTSRGPVPDRRHP